MSKWIRIQEQDNVAVALIPLKAGEEIVLSDRTLLLGCEIPQGHKFSLCDIPAGMPVIKYGASIGSASADIPAGMHVHTHNLKTGLREDEEYVYNPSAAGTAPAEELHAGGLPADGLPADGLPADGFPADGFGGQDTFQGFLRANGSVGIRNEIWVIPTVGCVNNIGQRLVSLARERHADSAGSLPGSVDELVAFQHPYGCSQLGGDQENTRKILADLCSHPNAGGVLLLGLGCENSGIEEIKKYMDAPDADRIRYLVCQESADEVEDGLALLDELIVQASCDQRTAVPVSRLVVGVKCGGSDGLSGITANPLVGRFTDRLTAQGGSVIMTEVPEMFGAETLLLNRCENEEIFHRAAAMIQNFKDYFSSHGQPVYENPSPGNKEGGITTLEDKSLGCTQKSGNALVRDVLDYGQKVQHSGLSLLYAPGNDLVSSTALAASGAHLVLFTTGRGTPFACPVPTVKISSNSRLHQHKSNWIDFNAGSLVDNPDYAQLTEDLYRYVLQVAGGKLVKAEEAGYHDMAIFKQNITL